MANESECLIYPALVSCLEGTFEGHVHSCARCTAALNLMRNLLREETPEEGVILNKVEACHMPYSNLMFGFY